jgi:hypothetical protein
MTDPLSSKDKLTKPQLDALERLLRGPEFWRGGSNAGGATRRMLNRMVTEGFLRGPPYYVTDLGRCALVAAKRITP